MNANSAEKERSHRTPFSIARNIDFVVEALTTADVRQSTMEL
jgi:hypothetical protein